MLVFVGIQDLVEEYLPYLAEAPSHLVTQILKLCTENAQSSYELVLYVNQAMEHRHVAVDDRIAKVVCNTMLEVRIPYRGAQNQVLTVAALHCRSTTTS